MTVIFLQNWVLCSVVLGVLTIFSSCGGNGNKINDSNDNSITNRSYNNLSEEIIDGDEYFVDTITVQSAVELINQIGSNRIIKLVGHNYSFNSTLLIDSIKNLKIGGTGFSELMISERNATVLKFQHCSNIHLDSLLIGHAESPGYIGDQGVLSVSDSYNITISNCKLIGAGNFGLVTHDVSDLAFSNSEITKCTGLLFELEKSKKIEFKNSKFYNNNLAISVLGGFTNSTKEVTFLNCDFLNNKPDMVGNPAFNFMGNWKDFDEKIIFKNCVFLNNKGYKWYGDKIMLENCKIDSTDFIGLQENE